MTPDYELDDVVAADTPEQLKAIADPLRTRILDLVLERAATVTELADALDRPRSSVAYHVDLLLDVGLLKVVRTRKVRAIDERFYGRVGRTIMIGDGPLPEGVAMPNFLAQALAEAVGDDPGDMRSTLRHARIPRARLDEFWERVADLSREFVTIPAEGDVVHGFVAAVYRTDQPTLPEPDDR